MTSKSKKELSGLIIFHRSYSYLNEPDSLARDDSLSWVPPVDIYETDEHYVVTAEIPGVERSDIRIEVAGSELSIRGERTFDTVCARESYHRLEGMRGSFQRKFPLPEALNNDEISANLENGVLQVILPKSRPKPSSSGSP